MIDVPATPVRVGIEDITDSATVVKLLRYDSTFGRFHAAPEDLGEMIAVTGHKIAVRAERDPARLARRKHGRVNDETDNARLVDLTRLVAAR
jgi:glyceraldehyde 3-phosphate dehydrogenase